MPEPLVTVEDVERYLRSVCTLAPRIHCPLGKTAGRVLCEPVIADRPGPPFDRVMMDGYAIRSTDISGGTFTVVSQAMAGSAITQLGDVSGSAVEVMTGAILPDGADAVIPYEWTTSVGGGFSLIERSSVECGQYIHRCGSDYSKGDVLVEVGCRLGPVEAAVAASCGYHDLSVAQLPCISLVSTGDELVPVESTPDIHQQRKSNVHAIENLLAQSGYPSQAMMHFSDDAESEFSCLEEVVKDADLVILSGGISKGKRDWIPGALDRLGRKVFHNVSQRPGKPMGLWQLPGCLVFALPGNPVSTILNARRWIIPYLLMRETDCWPSVDSVVVKDAFTNHSPFTQYLPVRLTDGGLAEYKYFQNSGDFASMIGTDGFVEIYPKAIVSPQSSVPFYSWT